MGHKTQRSATKQSSTERQLFSPSQQPSAKMSRLEIHNAADLSEGKQHSRRLTRNFHRRYGLLNDQATTQPQTSEEIIERLHEDDRSCPVGGPNGVLTISSAENQIRDGKETRVVATQDATDSERIHGLGLEELCSATPEVPPFDQSFQ